LVSASEFGRREIRGGNLVSVALGVDSFIVGVSVVKVPFVVVAVNLRRLRSVEAESIKQEKEKRRSSWDVAHKERKGK